VYPRSWNVWASLGDGLMAQGRDAEAAAALLRALSVDPTNWNSSVQLARVRELSAAR
jgi:cytochrome c-type biogenesis protein CcmH/NrfG